MRSRTSARHIFGAPSQPNAADVFNPIADRVIASLVLQAQDKPHSRLDVHNLGESGIRNLAGRRGDGTATNALWLQIATQWAKSANAFALDNSHRRSGTELQWWYESGPKAGRIRGDVADKYGNGPNDRKDISGSVVAGAADTSAWIAANHLEQTKGGGTRLVPNSSSSGGIGKFITFGLLLFGGYEAYKHRKAIKKALTIAAR